MQVKSCLSFVSCLICLILLLKDLQRSLKATCEDFITSITKVVVDPMLSFVTWCNTS
ncbi:hypothetical protein GIB67_012244 [Kingdonia uniflora]|uniref:Uncharacterized protein n=1 Tax=Kingdonia uniflora TaxID=39325 RepID=A0A7J7M9D2_9MAGN|nr:hypothetical protein GIB67_012244 [Kingdonia uniflora]